MCSEQHSFETAIQLNDVLLKELHKTREDKTAEREQFEKEINDLKSRIQVNQADGGSEEFDELSKKLKKSEEENSEKCWNLVELNELLDEAYEKNKKLEKELELAKERIESMKGELHLSNEEKSCSSVENLGLPEYGNEQPMETSEADKTQQEIKKNISKESLGNSLEHLSNQIRDLENYLDENLQSVMGDSWKMPVVGNVENSDHQMINLQKEVDRLKDELDKKNAELKEQLKFFNQKIETIQEEKGQLEEYYDKEVEASRTLMEKVFELQKEKRELLDERDDKQKNFEVERDQLKDLLKEEKRERDRDRKLSIIGEKCLERKMIVQEEKLKKEIKKLEEQIRNLKSSDAIKQLYIKDLEKELNDLKHVYPFGEYSMLSAYKEYEDSLRLQSVQFPVSDNLVSNEVTDEDKDDDEYATSEEYSDEEEDCSDEEDEDYSDEEDEEYSDEEEEDEEEEEEEVIQID